MGYDCPRWPYCRASCSRPGTAPFKCTAPVPPNTESNPHCAASGLRRDFPFRPLPPSEADGVRRYFGLDSSPADRSHWASWNRCSAASAVLLPSFSASVKTLLVSSLVWCAGVAILGHSVCGEPVYGQKDTHYWDAFLTHLEHLNFLALPFLSYKYDRAPSPRVCRLSILSVYLTSLRKHRVWNSEAR